MDILEELTRRVVAAGAMAAVDALRTEPRFIELCDQLRMPCAEY